MSFQNSYIATAPCFLTFVAVTPLLLFNFKIFVLNTSLFTFYITLCMSIDIQLYAWLQYSRSTDLLYQAYLYGIR